MKKFAAVSLMLALLLCSGCGTSGNVASSNNTPNSNASDSGMSSSADTAPLSESELTLMYSNPDNYKGRLVNLTGKVFVSPEKDESGIYIQMFADVKNNDRNTIVFYPDTTLDISNGDYVKLTGTVEGKFSGNNALGGEVTAATIKATNVEKSSYMEVVSPALAASDLTELSQTQLGYTVTLTRIEFASEETRLFVTIKNDGSANFNLYSFNAKLVQNGKQYDEESNYEADYPEIQTDLLPGTTTEGILTFPKMEAADVKVILKASSENYKEDIEPYEFDINFKG